MIFLGHRRLAKVPSLRALSENLLGECRMSKTGRYSKQLSRQRHSRLGEWIFGGMTSDLLTTSPICCLMSH